MFRKETIIKNLDLLSLNSCIGFGISCCERMVGNYCKFQKEVNWGDKSRLRVALDRLWDHVEGEKVSRSEIEALIESCESVAPDSDDFDSLFTSSAQEAVFAICCVLDFMLNEDQERIAQAAAFSVDTIDLYVQETLRVPANSPNLEKIISDHPLMRQEIDRQYSDLELLKETWKPAELRANWERPSQSNLGLRK